MAIKRAAKIMLNRPPSARPTSTSICSSNVDWTRRSLATKEFIHLMIIIFLPANEYESHARWLSTTSNASLNRARACAFCMGQRLIHLATVFGNWKRSSCPLIRVPSGAPPGRGSKACHSSAGVPQGSRMGLFLIFFIAWDSADKFCWVFSEVTAFSSLRVIE